VDAPVVDERSFSGKSPFMGFLCHRAKVPFKSWIAIWMPNYCLMTLRLGIQQICAKASQNIQHMIKQISGRRHPTSTMSSALLQIGE
jgi:hypothetical protein